ncbi:hypothetical protein [Streptomyces carminius]|uniref:hypothetical protein n=1 Tax=Streptomyces carminius TaxID=2665496 RepID=UPI0018EA79AD|nr:hypothetical protein [Streptomyces carminius]
MKLQKSLVVSLTAAMAVAGGAAVAQAQNGAKFENNSQVLSCDVIEVIDLPILSAANNNIDCSENYEEETHIKKVHKVEKEAKIIVAPEQEQAQGQGQGQETGAAAGAEAEAENKNKNVD